MIELLPPELLVEILCRLPFKPLISCTSVCKSWNCLIKSPEFITTHSSKTRNKHPHRLLLLDFDVYEESGRSERPYRCALHFDNRQLDEYMRLEFPFTGNSFRVIGCCNSLICLKDGDRRIILWNPMIRKWVTFQNSRSMAESDTWVNTLGFGYDSSANDYKVLSIHYDRSFSNTASIQVDVYSLNSGFWKSITSAHPKFHGTHVSPMELVNGKLHYIVDRRPRGDNDNPICNVILAYDLSQDEAFHEIMPPECLTNVPTKQLSVRAYGESSIAITWFHRTAMSWHVWVLKEYGKEASWTQIRPMGGFYLAEPQRIKVDGEITLKRPLTSIVTRVLGEITFDDSVRYDDDLQQITNHYQEGLGLLGVKNAINESQLSEPTKENDSMTMAGVSPYFQGWARRVRAQPQPLDMMLDRNRKRIRGEDTREPRLFAPLPCCRDIVVLVP